MPLRANPDAPTPLVGIDGRWWLAPWGKKKCRVQGFNLSLGRLNLSTILSTAHGTYASWNVILSELMILFLDSAECVYKVSAHDMAIQPNIIG